MWMSDLSMGRLADLLDDLSIGFCAFDVDDRTLGWNRTFLTFFPEHDGHVHVGESYRANLFRFYGSRLAPEEIPHIDEHVARGVARHQSQNRPFAFEHRGLSLQVSAQTVPGLGRIRLWKQIGRAEAWGGSDRLTAPGNELVSFGDAAPDGVAHITPNGRISSTNREFDRLYGLASNAASDLTFEEVVRSAWENARGTEPDHFGREVEPHLREALRFPGSAFEVPLPDARWVRVIEHVRTDAERTSVHFDITPQKREHASLRAAQAEAQRQAEHLRIVIGNAPIGMAILDRNGRLLETNKAFRQTLGVLDQGDLAGLPLAILMTSADAVVSRRLIETVEAKGHHRGVDLSFLRRDGTTIWAQASLAWLGAHVGPGSILLQIKDVTARRAAEQALREKTALLNVTVEAMDQGLMMVDAEGIVRLCNERAIQLLNLPESLMRGTPAFLEVVAYQRASGDFNNLPLALQTLLEDGGVKPHAHTYERERPNGAVLEVRTVLLPHGGWVRTYTDITQRKRAEMRIAQSEERLAHAIEATTDGLVDADLITGEAWVADRWWRILGYEPGDLEPHLRTWHSLLHPEDRDVAVRALQAHYAGQTPIFECEYRLRCKDGTWCWVAARGHAVRRAADGTPLRYVGTHTDISSRKAVEIKIAHMAHHDPLTGLPNRVRFRERLDQALARSARTGTGVAVLACDLDLFKSINDTLGHPAGDALLRIVAQRLSANLRPCDTIARLGGDEFAIVVDHLDEPLSTAYLAQRLIAATSRPVMLDGRRIEVGLSIGFAEATAADADADLLFKRADIALYEAKAAGRNTFREFETQAGARATIHGQLALDMKEALRRGDFRLVYQPIVDIASGRVTSFEALLRWTHPVHGDISPAVFIPMAEETGLIAQIGAHVLHEACAAAARWPDDVRVAVNVSVVQLRYEGIEREVLQALAAARLMPGRLKLEVTESVLVQEAENALTRLRRIKDLGVRIVLDDFGTGYSALSYLRLFPFDKIKLDRSFIADIANEDTAAIVRAVVGIGERLSMGVVAEGVETAEQLELVRHEGCGEVQGFFYSRPMPAGEVLGYIQAQNRTPHHEEATRLWA